MWREQLSRTLWNNQTAGLSCCYCRDTAFAALQAWPGGLQLGGGVNLDNAIDYLDAGASHVIVTSFVFRDGRLEEDRLRDLVSPAVTAHQLGLCLVVQNTVRSRICVVLLCLSLQAFCLDFDTGLH